MASEESDDEKKDGSVPKTKKGTLRGAGAVKNPLVAAMEAKYDKKVPLIESPSNAGGGAESAPEPPVEADAEETTAAEPEQAEAKGDDAEAKPDKPKFQLKKPDEVGSVPPPPPIEEAPPPPPSIDGSSALSKPPPAPPPARKPQERPPKITGVPKGGKTKLGMPTAKPEIDAPGGGAGIDLPPLGDMRTILVGGGVVFAMLLILILVVVSVGGDDEGEIAEADETTEPAPTDPEEAPDIEPPPAPEPAPEIEEPEVLELTPEQEAEIERLRASALEHYRGGRFRRAAADYRAAAAIDPDDAGLYAGMGASLAQMDETEAAIAAYREAARIDPHSSGFQAALGRVLRAGGHEEEALAAYRQALVIDPENRAAQRALREMTGGD